MKKPLRLIGIHGFKGSGKDTVANMIAARVREVEGYLCPITHYADRLKRAAASLFDLDLNLFYDEVMKEATQHGLCYKTTIRKIMTDMHDALVPMFGPDLFVHPVRQEWQRWLGSGVFIIADVRYDGRETDWIRQAGGLLVHVRRPGVGPSAHSSEAGVAALPGDLIINNDGPLDDLKCQVERLLVRHRNHVPSHPSAGLTN